MNTNAMVLAEKIYAALRTKKFKELEVLDVQELTSLTDVFIIIVAENDRQTRALADEIEYSLGLEAIHVARKEGHVTSKWILLDYEDVIVHVLCKEEAEFYGLNRLWKDATTVLMK